MEYFFVNTFITEAQRLWILNEKDTLNAAIAAFEEHNILYKRSRKSW